MEPHLESPYRPTPFLPAALVWAEAGDPPDVITPSGPGGVPNPRVLG